MQTLINSKQIENYLINELGMENIGRDENTVAYGKDTGEKMLFFIVGLDSKWGVPITLTVTDANKNSKDLFNDYVATSEEFSKIVNLAKTELEGIRLNDLGVTNKGEQEYSEREIRDMIDAALDSGDFKEVDRLSKMLPEQMNKLMENITRIKQLMK
jgi:hypothetical protein